MALSPAIAWEIRTTGNNNNGGGFSNFLPGTSVDYSQQNAPQLSLNDLACVLATANLTSAIGGFTNAMIGNVINITGGVNFTPGFYQIVGWTSLNQVLLDRSPVAGGNGSNGIGNVGGALADNEQLYTVAVAGNFIYIQNGNYSLTANRTFTNTNVRTFGYDTSRLVRPSGNSRPLIAMAGFTIQTQLQTVHENLRFTGTAATMFDVWYDFPVFRNSYFKHNANAGTVYIINVSQIGVAANSFHGTIIDCEFEGTAGATSIGFYMVGRDSDTLNIGWLVAFCFFHDITYGYWGNDGGARMNHGETFVKNTFARIGTTAIRRVNSYTTYGRTMCVCFNNFYQAQYFVRVHFVFGHFVYGNTFDNASVVACQDDSADDTWFINNNDFWNNALDVQNCIMDLNNIGLDPQWVNPAANDFNFQPTSPNVNQPLGIRLGV